MTMKLHFLGTGCMVPTKERNHLAIALEYEGNYFLFDCGEGTQRQMREMKLPFGRFKRIFLSHWHGDHVIGLNGLVQTLSNTDNIERIEIYGPKDSKKYVDHMLKSTIFVPRVEIVVKEFDPKEGETMSVIDTPNYTIECAALQHSVPCIGYSFKEKDKFNVDKEKAKKLGLDESPLLARAKMGLPIELEDKIIEPEELTYKKEGVKVSFVFDTRPCIGVDMLAKDADHLIMEATYIFGPHGEKAQENDHMSAKETAEIAQANNVKHLIITHFSQRYKDTKDIEAEARETFENTTSTYDLMTYKIR